MKNKNISETLEYKSKESFNYGNVAFGSHSNKSLWGGARRPSFLPKPQAPGPGAYMPETVKSRN